MGENQTISGTCQTMCPEKEFSLREREGLLHPFEVQKTSHRTKRPPGDRGKTVKSYSRPAAGKRGPHPGDLRPAPVLVKTVNYLIDNISSKDDGGWTMVYEYVFDRLRAVRQDAVIQRIHGSPLVEILEKVIRFHIFSSYRLAMEPQLNFDTKINDTHVQESLKRLLRVYEVEEDCNCQNRKEFESIYILYNLGNTEALHHYLTLSKTMRNNEQLKLAFAINQAYLLSNYVRFFRLVKNLNIMGMLAVHRHFAQIEWGALKIMASGFHSKNLRYPISNLSNILQYGNDDHLINTCKQSGFDVTDQGVQFMKTSFNQASKVPIRHCSFIDEILESYSVVDILHGIT
ncbi:SAC3 domain-containing protein 1-like [Lineus longissimus]|uniref:SAC3 domain-containing protein 1-like n=1 Tax=Lineus longissimus TaxID=88925 RepID=UPI002B4D4DE1